MFENLPIGTIVMVKDQVVPIEIKKVKVKNFFNEEDKIIYDYYGTEPYPIFLPYWNVFFDAEHIIEIRTDIK